MDAHKRECVAAEIRVHWRPFAVKPFFRAARGGVNLVRIGHDADVACAAEIDSFDMVPELNLETWKIR